MNAELLFDFTVDKATSTINIKREFTADIDLVWDAFTKAEILDQWMGPKPWRVQTKEMDFREGGRWLYAMMSPENVNVSGRYSLVEFTRIQPKTAFDTKNSFSDENGNHADTGFSFSLNEYTFTAGEDMTTVEIVKKMGSLDELEKFIAMGYKEGMSVVLNNLDEYFRNNVGKK